MYKFFRVYAERVVVAETQQEAEDFGNQIFMEGECAHATVIANVDEKAKWVDDYSNVLLQQHKLMGQTLDYKTRLNLVYRAYIKRWGQVSVEVVEGMINGVDTYEGCYEDYIDLNKEREGK